MLLKFLSRLARKPQATAQDRLQALLEQATQARRDGEIREVIKLLREFLEIEPTNVPVLNDLASCLAEVGQLQEAAATFELAYSLDDTFIPAMVNHAKVLADQQRSGEALPFLRRAKIAEPHFLHSESIYASTCMARGDVARARRHQQRAWLADFDTLRAANAHLFWAAYDDLPEEQIAAEHRFWADTLRPPAAEDGPATQLPPMEPLAGRRIRIGYLSPDFRSHSVRYFFRPLLEHHDRSRWEVYLFHDFHGQDQETTRIREAAEHFVAVHEMSDARLAEHLRELNLDILVDLAGHTSYNRASLLQQRLAHLQVNALGYPPTTGLAAMDYKLLDRLAVGPEPACYYTEQPMVLPTSFWCFDPLEDIPMRDEPPCARNGHVTFGCVGNISKITDKALHAWRRILDRVPGARLLVRSISFGDDDVLRHMEDRMVAAGLPMDRVDLRKPQSGPEFYASYHEIDIILDTYPFNGGTTTSIATYMGVPVVTLAGASLLSRMGLSIMTNLGAADLVVQDWDAYVERCVALAGDAAYLTRFKREARARYASTALGNGAMFAAEFEAACLQALEALPASAGAPRQVHVPYLPPAEIMRRAYATLRHGQFEAAERILQHCLRGYPDYGPAHLLRAQQWSAAGRHADAVQYLTERLPSFSPADQVSTLIALVRMHLLQDERDAAAALLDRLDGLAPEDAYDRDQVHLFRACLEAPALPPAQPAPSAARRVLWLVPCDDAARYDRLASAIAGACAVPQGWQLRFERCAEADRVAAYTRALTDGQADVVVLMQKNVSLVHPQALAALEAALADADVVGFAGATRWERLDWRADAWEHKAAGFITASTDREGASELHLVGPGHAALHPGMAVLDGALLAIRTGPQVPTTFDEEMLGCDTLLEEYWSHQAARAGCRLAAHRNLGVSIDATVPLDASNRVEARMRCSTSLGFDPFAPVSDDTLALSAPVSDPVRAAAVCDAYLAEA